MLLPVAGRTRISLDKVIQIRIRVHTFAELLTVTRKQLNRLSYSQVGQKEYKSLRSLSDLPILLYVCDLLVTLTLLC